MDFAPEEAFRRAMLAAGVGAPEGLVVGDGEIHRFRSEGDRPGQRSGWYVLHVGGRPAGAFGCWRQGVTHKWRANYPSIDSTEIWRNGRFASVATRRADCRLPKRQVEAAKRARAAFAASPPAFAHHPYLVRKAVRPHALRQADDVLLVPLFGADGKIWSLQQIASNGQKRFRAGCSAKGCFSPIGDLGGRAEVVLICEGWATGATLHEQFGCLVLAAMTCGNLKPVALFARRRWPRARIIIAGDNDRGSATNTGWVHATEAASAAGVCVVFPEFPDDEPGTDFNDLANLRR